MAQQHTPAAGSGTSPATGAQEPPRTRHIFAILYVERLASLAVMHKLHTAGTKRARYQDTAYTNAIWNACCSLHYEASRHLSNAVKDGLLLFCWDGSKVVELTNEVPA